MNSLPKRLAIVFVILIGVYLRVHDLDELPPGLSYDEGYNALEVLHLSRTLEPAIFYPENNGREPLVIYLNSVALLLFGNRPLSFRLVSAYAGILTIPLVYLLGRDLSVLRRNESVTVGLVVAAILATLFWHVNFSRFVLRAILMIPLLTLSVWAYHRGRRQRPYFLLSGLALGVSFYTYLSARLMPAVFIGFLATQYLPYVGGRVRLWLKGSVITLLIGTLVFAPLGGYFLMHPEAFWMRVEQTSVFKDQGVQGAVVQVAENGLAAGRMFFDRGEREPWYNLPGRPALDLIGALGFAVGMVLALKGFREDENKLVLVWLAVMLLPTVFSSEAPKFIRVVGVIPPMCLIAGRGLYQLWTIGSRYLALNRPMWRPIAFILLVAITGSVTYRDYFQRWASLPEVTGWYGVAESELSNRLLAINPAYDVVVPGNIFYHVTTRYMLESSLGNITMSESLQPQYPLLFLYPAGRCRLQRVMVLFHRDAETGGIAATMNPADILPGAWLTSSNTLGWSGDELDYTLVRELYAEQDGDYSRLQSGAVGATLDDRLCLLSYEVQAHSIQPGGTVQLTLYWEKLDVVATDYQVAVQLASHQGDRLGHSDSQLLAHSQWQPGEVVSSTHVLTVPPDVLPGKYQFGITVTDGGQPLALVNDVGGYVDDHVLAGNLTVSSMDSRPEAISYPVEFSFGKPAIIQLLGYDLRTTNVRPGEMLDVTFYFKANSLIDEDYTVFLHLFDAAGQLYAQYDGEPGGGRLPTSWWLPGEVVVDPLQLTLPADLPPGEYTLSAGLYLWTTGERLSLFSGDGRLAEDRLTLPTPIRVSGDN